MATIGSAKATLVNKIDTLTASATAKDTIYLAKALKENTTHHSFTFQGAWTATTAYALDDVVTTSGKTYICIVAHTSGASFAVGSNWSLMAEKGTDGTDLTTTLTTAGDVVYKGASALTRLAKGTASQVLTMNSGATAPEWADAAGGGAWTLIGTAVASDDAALTITGINGTYQTYAIIFSDIIPSTNSARARMQLGNAGGFLTAGGYGYSEAVLHGAGGAAQPAHTASGNSGLTTSNGNPFIAIGSNVNVGNAASNGRGIQGQAYLHNPFGGTAYPSWHIESTCANDTGNRYFYMSHKGTRPASEDITQLKLYFSTGNVASGRLSVYGIKHT